MDFVESLIKETGNEYAGIAADGIVAGDIKGFTDSGSLYLNALISASIFKGLPDGKVTALAGPSGTGKSYILLSMIKNFLEDNPEGYAFLFESESALTKQMLVERGIDAKRVVIIPVVTVQEFRNQCVKLLDKYLDTKDKNKPKIFVALDSLGMLSTTKEMDDASSGSDKKDMTRAQLIRSVFRVITLKLGRASVPMVITNHSYQTMDLFSKNKMSGGEGLVYAASTILFLGKGKEKEDKQMVGAIIYCTLEKGRLTREQSKCLLYINFSTGMSRYYGLTQVAIDMGLWEKVTAKEVIVSTLTPSKEELISGYDDWFTEELFKRINKDVGLADAGVYAGLWKINEKGKLESPDGTIIPISHVRKDPRSFFTVDAIKSMLYNEKFDEISSIAGTFGVRATTVDIAKNPEKYFTEKVLKDIDKYLYSKFAYGAIMEDEFEGDEITEKGEN